MNEWYSKDKIWSLTTPTGDVLIRIKHDPELNEYVTLPDGKRLGKVWGDAARDAEGLIQPSAPAQSRKKGR